MGWKSKIDITILSLEIVFVLTNNTYMDKCGISSGSSLFARVPVYIVPVNNELTAFPVNNELIYFSFFLEAGYLTTPWDVSLWTVHIHLKLYR